AGDREDCEPQFVDGHAGPHPTDPSCQPPVVGSGSSRITNRNGWRATSASAKVCDTTPGPTAGRVPEVAPTSEMSDPYQALQNAPPTAVEVTVSGLTGSSHGPDASSGLFAVAANSEQIGG